MDVFLELAKDAYLSYKSGTPEERQELVKTVFSNCEINEKNVYFEPYFPFQLMAERPAFTVGSPYREAARTFSSLFKKLFKYFQNSVIAKSGDEFSNYITSKSGGKFTENFPAFNGFDEPVAQT